MKFLFLFLFLFTVRIFAKETIKINGGAAPIENIFKKIHKPFESANPNYDLIILEDGPSEAIKQLNEGLIDLATAGLNPEDWQELSKNKNYPVSLSQFQFRALGRDVVKVYLNPGLAKIKKLSDDQLTGIFTGKLKNWKSVGGPDQKIVLVFGKKIPGTYLFFQKNIMNNLKFAKGIEADVSLDVQNLIFKTKGAIGLGSHVKLVKELVVPEIKGLGRQIYSATKGTPPDKIRTLLEYIHQDGARYIKEIDTSEESQK